MDGYSPRVSETDQRIGQNLARLRGSLSQKDLADLMRERGWKWSQATVWSVERGDRPLRLAEAEDLARILRQATGSVFARGEWEGRFEDAWTVANSTHNVLEVAVEQYTDAQMELASAVDGGDLPPEQQADVLELLQETAVAIARKKSRGMTAGFSDDGAMTVRLSEAYRAEEQ